MAHLYNYKSHPNTSEVRDKLDCLIAGWWQKYCQMYLTKKHLFWKNVLEKGLYVIYRQIILACKKARKKPKSQINFLTPTTLKKKPDFHNLALKMPIWQLWIACAVYGCGTARALHVSTCWWYSRYAVACRHKHTHTHTTTGRTSWFGIDDTPNELLALYKFERVGSWYRHCRWR
jgi:hypothetical protein